MFRILAIFVISCLPGTALAQDIQSTKPDSSITLADNANQEPGIVELDNILIQIKTQLALFRKIAKFQNNLVKFAETNPYAAYPTRIPKQKCTLEARFCNAMFGSFQNPISGITGPDN